jgi:hypothetical protein
MLDEIAGQAILKIPLSPGSCVLGSDDEFDLNGHEHRAQHREQEKDLPADRSMFMFGHGLERL